MSVVDGIVIAVIAGVVTAAIFAIRRAKKQGKKCIGCPNSGTCSSCCGGDCHRS